MTDHQLADSLHARHVPFVLVNRHAGDYPAVTCDDVLGGQLAAEHLLQLGHTRVAVIAGEPYASTGIDRTAGFTGMYAAAGHPVAAETLSIPALTSPAVGMQPNNYFANHPRPPQSSPSTTSRRSACSV